MPLLSRHMLMLYGIRISMYPEAFGKHHKKHVHVIFDNHQEAVIDVCTLEQIEGDYISRQYKRYLFDWLERHQAELIEMFAKGEPYKID